jgi:hypothetical protein
VIFREFDGLGLGIKDHDAIISAWSLDLQIIPLTLQVKTPSRNTARPSGEFL